VTAPALAGTSPNGHRIYTWQGRDYPSVTAIINGGVPAPFLVRWAAKAAADYAVANLDHLRHLPTDQAVREVKQAPWARRDQAASLGDQVHAAIDAHTTGRPRPTVPPEAVPYLAAFDRFLLERNPAFLASEQTVYSRRFGYAGTFDAICTLPRLGVVLVDVKTGRRIYPEVALQLAAYAHADFIGHPDHTEAPLPELHAAAVLHLRPSGYRLVQVPIGQAVLEAFLAALAVFRFATDLAPTLLAAGLTDPGPGPGLGA
jgi:hypothetical protein